MANVKMSAAQEMLKAQTTGPLFASILFQQAVAEGDQEGFLVGEWRTRRTDEINDNNIQATREDVTLDIHALLPSIKVHQFYNNIGEVSTTSLQQILGQNAKNVVGWYRFRRNTCLEVLLLERAIHQKLASLLSSQQAAFVFAIFTSSTSANASVHSFDHTFLRFVNGQFENIPLSVINLGNTSHLEYKTHSRPSISKYLRQMHVPESANASIDSSASIGTIQGIHQVLQGNLQGMHRQVLESEASIQQYLMDIASMEEQLEQKSSEARKQVPAKDIKQLEKEKSELNKQLEKEKSELIPGGNVTSVPGFIKKSEEQQLWCSGHTGRSGDDRKQPPPTS